MKNPQNTQLPQNNEPKKMPKQPKTIWPELNPKTTWFLHSLASIDYISCFNSKLQIVWSVGFPTSEAWNPYMACPKKLMGLSPNFESKSTSLCYHALCAALLQLVISPLFQLWIVIHLKHWIPEFLSFKNLMRNSLKFELKLMPPCCQEYLLLFFS